MRWKGFCSEYLAYYNISNTNSCLDSFIYLVAFFLLADGLNTTGTLIGTIQNQIVSFSFLQLTYLGLSQAATSTASTFGFWYVQQYFGLKTKHMFMVTNFFSVFIPFYGMLGLWTEKVGYHHVRDFWIYNILFGLFQAPYYAYAQTMMSEVTPRGYENMFFGLFGITNRAVSCHVLAQRSEWCTDIIQNYRTFFNSRSSRSMSVNYSEHWPRPSRSYANAE